MGDYRKKPVVIQAVRWTGTNGDEVLRFIYEDERWKEGLDDGGYVDGPGIGMVPALGTLDIPTLEGVMTANAGDWIIRGVKGEIYPCKPEIFDATTNPPGVKEMSDSILEVVRLVVVDGVEGPSLYLDDYRVSGPKPWGGGEIVQEFRASREAVETALGLRNSQPPFEKKYVMKGRFLTEHDPEWGNEMEADHGD